MPQLMPLDPGFFVGASLFCLKAFLNSCNISQCEISLLFSTNLIFTLSFLYSQPLRHSCTLKVNMFRCLHFVVVVQLVVKLLCFPGVETYI